MSASKWINDPVHGSLYITAYKDENLDRACELAIKQLNEEREKKFVTEYRQAWVGVAPPRKESSLFRKWFEFMSKVVIFGRTRGLPGG